MKNKSPYPKGKMPAHPPEDYKGTIADWITALAERGYEPEKYDWYGDILIDEDVLFEILEECEEK